VVHSSLKECHEPSATSGCRKKMLIHAAAEELAIDLINYFSGSPFPT